MKAQRFAIHLVSVSLLVLWGAVLIYFYASGRVVHYLPSDGFFRPLMLGGGIGMIILGLFNLITYSQGEGACCGHEHDHDHDHSHGDKDGHHHHHDGCCGHEGHEHDHGKAHQHAHEHGKECCGHDDDHDHDHGHAHHHHEGCGHTHHHDHAHAHTHAEGGHDHSHGILEESGWVGRLVAILILAAPLSWAAIRTPDEYSANAIINKNLYNPTYGTGARAEQFSLKKDLGRKTTPATTDVVAAPQAPSATAPTAIPANPAPGVQSSPPAVTTAPVKTPPAGMATSAPSEEVIAQKAAASTSGTAEAKSYGSFSLEDLKKQVPQSKEGNFILEVPEIYYTAGDQEIQKVITGQPVETVAQVLPEKVNNDSGHRLRIFRMLIQCCAADARPYSVPVDFGKKAPEFKDMTWVKVTGKMSYKKEGDQIVPIIEATGMEETTAPENSMIY